MQQSGKNQWMTSWGGIGWHISLKWEDKRECKSRGGFFLTISNLAARLLLYATVSLLLYVRSTQGWWDLMEQRCQVVGMGDEPYPSFPLGLIPLMYTHPWPHWRGLLLWQPFVWGLVSPNNYFSHFLKVTSPFSSKRICETFHHGNKAALHRRISPSIKLLRKLKTAA